MKPDDVCAALSKIGADVSRRTLLHYEEWGLIPEPHRGGGGPGGRFSEYPDETVEEAYAAWRLIHGRYGDVVNSIFDESMTPRMPPGAVKILRQMHYSGKVDKKANTYEEAATEYKKYSGEILKNLNKYYNDDTEFDEFTELNIRSYLSNASIESIEAMEEISLGFLRVWQAQIMLAKALLIIKEVRI